MNLEKLYSLINESKVRCVRCHKSPVYANVETVQLLCAAHGAGRRECKKIGEDRFTSADVDRLCKKYGDRDYSSPAISIRSSRADRRRQHRQGASSRHQRESRRRHGYRSNDVRGSESESSPSSDYALQKKSRKHRSTRGSKSDFDNIFESPFDNFRQTQMQPLQHPARSEPVVNLTENPTPGLAPYLQQRRMATAAATVPRPLLPQMYHDGTHHGFSYPYGFEAFPSAAQQSRSNASHYPSSQFLQEPWRSPAAQSGCVTAYGGGHQEGSAACQFATNVGGLGVATEPSPFSGNGPGSTYAGPRFPGRDAFNAFNVEARSVSAGGADLFSVPYFPGGFTAMSRNTAQHPGNPFQMSGADGAADTQSSRGMVPGTYNTSLYGGVLNSSVSGNPFVSLPGPRSGFPNRSSIPGGSKQLGLPPNAEAPVVPSTWSWRPPYNAVGTPSYGPSAQVPRSKVAASYATPQGTSSGQHGSRPPVNAAGSSGYGNDLSRYFASVPMSQQKEWWES